VLTAEQKKLLFDTAASKDEWLAAYCAAVLAVNTTCRGIELKNLRWADADLFQREMAIRRSKTDAGRRDLPINSDAMAALARLRQRAEDLGSAAPEHFVFPACERNRIDPTKPQKTWRTAWRSLVEEAATRAGDAAAKIAEAGGNVEEARKRAMLPFINADGQRLQFHDLRHQAITELAEAGAPDATIEALAGHLSREMMEHYSHVRMAAKRAALDRLAGGLMRPTVAEEKPVSEAVN
jgi:integrase